MPVYTRRPEPGREVTKFDTPKKLRREKRPRTPSTNSPLDRKSRGRRVVTSGDFALPSASSGLLAIDIAEANEVTDMLCPSAPYSALGSSPSQLHQGKDADVSLSDNGLAEAGDESRHSENQRLWESEADLDEWLLDPEADLDSEIAGAVVQNAKKAPIEEDLAISKDGPGAVNEGGKAIRKQRDFTAFVSEDAEDKEQEGDTDSESDPDQLDFTSFDESRGLIPISEITEEV